MSIGKKLKDLRLRTKKTLKEQSETFGVSINSVYRWEHDLAVPRKSVLKKIADFYNVPLQWLLQENSEEESIKYHDGVHLFESNMELQLLKMYKKLSDTKKYKVLGYIERMYVEDLEE